MCVFVCVCLCLSICASEYMCESHIIVQRLRTLQYKHTNTIDEDYSQIIQEKNVTISISISNFLSQLKTASDLSLIHI